MSQFEIKEFNSLTEEQISSIVELDKLIFSHPYPIEKIRSELETKHGLVAHLAYKGEQLCGFKMGYMQTTKRFYSWLGGVHPEHRRQGLARELMDLQHQKAKGNGYEFVVTHTKNEFREMLLFNISYGFDVIGIRADSAGDAPSIILQKSL